MRLNFKKPLPILSKFELVSIKLDKIVLPTYLQ